jgi:putative Mn2+ efflux pump MntP
MSLVEIIILAFALSMDAFAVAVSIGITQKRPVTVGFYFGVFQAGMPLAGYFAASIFAESVAEYGSWIAFGILVFLGGKMIFEGFKKEKLEADVSARRMVPLALATSIDAFAVGVSFALTGERIFAPVVVIGVVAFVISACGVLAGNFCGEKFGEKIKSRAAFIGGGILILIGMRILFVEG